VTKVRLIESMIGALRILVFAGGVEPPRDFQICPSWNLALVLMVPKGEPALPNALVPALARNIPLRRQLLLRGAEKTKEQQNG
jgi:hypothetical protein